ncbi:DUF3857 domain-containing protein [Solitalea sp. MAHUQ-68]|uniref:DUF3857 domain-containing protein n=1 Tax=Solitalea agri TaxID=2953739 RepID=A0A9X2F2G1_9SPHI|nr:DUF3857 domain-containing protein [Solitalea agri]MCO4293474.1 DUF3857 domain-containing protein [Solitalea agri]
MNCSRTHLGMFLTFLLFPLAILAQKPTIKYGKVSMEELTMPVYSKDSSANAVVLADIGNTYFSFTNNEFEVVHERHCRIKIFNKAALDAAEIIIPYYSGVNTKEKITQLKGATYLLENGKISEYKLDSKAIFDELVTGNYRQRKLTLPNVKEGAVIEFVYTIRSDSYTFFKEWEFQTDYPVIWSEYTGKIPEYFYYKLETQGYNSFFINEKKEAMDQFVITWKGEYNGNNYTNVRSQGGSEAVSAKSTIYHWAMKDVPAFEDDKYITTANDYISKIKFQLQGVQYPQSAYRGVLNTWEKVTEAIYASDGFASSMNRTGFLKDQIKQLSDRYTDPVSKSFAITSFLKKNVKWNGDNSMWAAQTPKTVFEKKSGNSADINLLLVGMLREAGLAANPVLVSTRKHGRVNEYYPMIDNFNYVIASVRLDSTDLLLDATDPFRPAYLLPERCLNGKGRLIDEKGVGRWLALEDDQVRAKKAITVNISIKEGKLNGTALVYDKDYAAANTRSQLAEATSKDEYIKEKYKSAGLSITNFSLENTDRVDTAMVTKLSFEFEEEVSNGILYLNPILFSTFEGNAFKAKQRTYPVNYPTLYDIVMLSTVTIPPGYTVEELPKSTKYTLSEDGAKFSYLIGQVDDKIQVRSVISFNKTTFLADEYEGLKNFYAALAAKLAEQIVLKKVSQ